MSAIRTERLTLRPFTPADADAAFDAITPSLTRFLAFDPPPSHAAFETVWRRWLVTIADRTDLVFVIRHGGTGLFIGLSGVHATLSPEPELGIWISETEQGKGYGREAVRAVATWAATVFSPQAFRYPVAEANAASRRIAESLCGTVIAREATPKFASVVYRIPSPRP
ncbi:GNAT family N-acetyltransferase [Gemmobacter aquarius]|uniref:GNAT family N-acetyltransferase n=1 Tax=Paragemmobacter aquarius TaxID=2169400 RepID=A0A2S0ULG1_9RHOB|nr:GNAT family N-acetyltransferase [Gemmobacter aquarius]